MLSAVDFGLNSGLLLILKVPERKWNNKWNFLRHRDADFFPAHQQLDMWGRPIALGVASNTLLIGFTAHRIVNLKPYPCSPFFNAVWFLLSLASDTHLPSPHEQIKHSETISSWHCSEVSQLFWIPLDTVTDEHTCDALSSQVKHFIYPLLLSKDAFDEARAPWISRGESEVDGFVISANEVFDRKFTTDVCFNPPLFTSAM